jgi:Concanavalin A-like lectin/glucanases superfamily
MGYMVAGISASSRGYRDREMRYHTESRDDIFLPRSGDRPLPSVRKGERGRSRRECEEESEQATKGHPAEARLPRARRRRETGLPVYFWPLVGGIGFAVLLLVVLLAVTLGGRKAPESARPGQPPPGGGPLFEPQPARLAKEPPPVTNLAGVLAYWSFDEGQGAQAKDALGQHGTVHGGRWIRGVRGKALQFQTWEDYFDYGGSPRFNFPAGSAFSFTGWIQTKATEGTIVSQRNRADGGPVIYIGLAGGHLQAQVRQDRGESSDPTTVTGPAVNNGEWHHFVLIRQAGGAIELSVDGQPGGRGTGTHAGGAITTNLRSLAREQFWYSVRRGAGDPFWSGCIDEFAVFNRALTAEEIRSLAGQGP